MSRTPHRTHLSTLLVCSFALAVAGATGRAQAQEEEDDKLPEPVTHHVVHAQGEGATDDESRTQPPAKAEPEPAPSAKPAATPEPQAVESKAAPVTAPPAKKRHKETPREKRERLRKEKLEKRRKKMHRGGSEPAADEQQAPTAEPLVTPHEAGEGEARRPAGGDMDFELIPQKAQSTEEATSIERKIKTRRTMLQLHQGFGIATAALMAGTVITGQLNYSDRFGGSGSGGQYEGWHDALEAATVVSFATAGLLAVLSPSPFEHKSDGVDTVTVHKWTMLVATIGMGAEVPLGIWTVTREGYVNQGTLALTHLIVGYVTAAALTVGATALFF